MLRYLLVVYGLGGAWVWWLAVSRGTSRVVVGFVLLAATVGLALATWGRSRRLRSPWEWIPSRAVTHGGAGPGSSRWHRGATTRPEDPGDFEAHVGGTL
ncbi:MAG: hypothetical protein A2Z12_08825 [Actinobacteria bacterium RBG_16_68_21]|nr:MAG: hypothetical protein A2Z12_08825 [Actinobacteria bacterium RBG_16_68_21]